MTAPTRDAAPAEVTERRGSLLDQILDEQSVVDLLRPLIPRGESWSRIRSAIKLEEKKNPKLKECTPGSLVDCVARALRLGLEIGTECYLIPFAENYKDAAGSWQKRQVCTFVPSYRSHVALALRTGAVRSVEAHVVYENERFELTLGSHAQLTHQPIHDPNVRGAMIGAYYVIRLPGAFGGELFDFIPLHDIEEVRTKSKQWSPQKVKACPAWWAKKRAVIVGLNLIPKNPRHRLLVDGLRADNEVEFDAGEQLAALDDMDDRPVPPQEPEGSHAVSEPTYGDESNEAWDRMGEALRDGPRDADPYNLRENAPTSTKITK